MSISDDRRQGGRNRLISAALLLMALLPAVCFHGCTTMTKTPPPAQPIMPAAFEAGIIAELEQKLAIEDEAPADQSDQAAVLLHLAMLYSHPDNPSPDLTRAVDCLEQFSELETDPQVDARYALGLLARVKQCLADRSADQARAGNKIKQLENRNQALLVESRENLEIIEKLKRLDIQIEKKRGDFE